MTTLTFEERERRAYITNDPVAPVLGELVDAEFEAIEEAEHAARAAESDAKAAEERCEDLEVEVDRLSDRVAELEAREDLA